MPDHSRQPDSGPAKIANSRSASPKSASSGPRLSGSAMMTRLAVLAVLAVWALWPGLRPAVADSPPPAGSGPAASATGAPPSDGQPGAVPAPSYRVAVVTGPTEVGTGDVFGIADLIARHGEAAAGGKIVHAPFGPEVVGDPEALARFIEDQAADPLVRAIVVNQAVEGTAEGFRRVKAARPDVLRLAAEPHEPHADIAAPADLLLAGNHVAQGYLVPWAAKRLGVRTVVHLSFERHLGIEQVALRRLIMKAACGELGLEFVDAAVADPADSPESADDMAGIFAGLVAAHGPETAFFPTAYIHLLPLAKEIARTGQGFMLEADLPSVLKAFPEALDAEPPAEPVDWNQRLRRLELAAEATPAAGRLGVWQYPLGFSQTAALAEHGMRVAEGRALGDDLADILESLRLSTPGVNWSAGAFTDSATGASIGNFVMAYHDIYILGLGNIGTTEVEIPPAYYSIGLGDGSVAP